MLLFPLLFAFAAIASQTGAQKQLDDAIAHGDHVRIDYVNFRPKDRIFICEISAREDIDALSKLIQLRIDAPVKEVIDGRELLVQRMPGRVDAPGCFRLVIEKNHEPIITVVVYDDDLVGISSIVEDSTIKADKKALAPLWNRLVQALHEKKANQTPEPTALLVTPRADARVAPSNAVAHL